MRFKLTLNVEKDKFGNILPINYSYELSAAIYKILAKADSEYAEWLHENGFQLNGKRFKFFTFSRLHVPEYKVIGDRIALLSNTINWFISFLPEKSTETFIKGVFSDQVFRLGDTKSRVQFHIKGVELLESPSFCSTVSLKTISPVCISYMDSPNKVTYMDPDNPLYEKHLYSNLINKYKVFTGKDYFNTDELKFELINKPKSSLITIKSGTREQTKVRGYDYLFKLSAPDELIKIAYECGLGEKNSIGFGMVGVV